LVEEPTESIVKELREMKIEEASEGDLNIDKVKVLLGHALFNNLL